MGRSPRANGARNDAPGYVLGLRLDYRAEDQGGRHRRSRAPERWIGAMEFGANELVLGDSVARHCAALKFALAAVL